MQPPINPAEEPPFHKLDEYLFQKLCRDLLAVEPGISSAVVYGARGERQLGIDVRAQRYQPAALEVGQCKRYEQFTPADIRKASDEFFEHWEYWKTQNVQRFILFVTAEVSSRRHIAEIDEQVERFKRHSILYEVWPSNKIREKLRDHPHIVAKYLYPPAYWIESICGITGASLWRHLLDTSAPPTSARGNYYVDQIDVLAGHIALGIDQQISELRQHLRAGRHEEVYVQIQAVKNNQVVWERLAASVKARLLRLEARIALIQRRDTYHASQFADEARRLAPDEVDEGLQAHILYYTEGAEVALNFVAAGGTLERDNLRVAFLLELGRVEEAQAVLEQLASQYNLAAETFRLSALLSLVTKNVEQARLAIERALELEPDGEAIRFAGACINYFSALTSAAYPSGLPSVPEPVDWIFIRRDDTSLSRLRAAATTFSELIELAHDQAAQRRLLVWRMASLANDEDAQDEVIALCSELLRREPVDAVVVSWVLARGYEVELDNTKKILRRLIREGRATPENILLLVQCFVAERQIAQAIQLLHRYQLNFVQAQMSESWETWILQLQLLKGDRKTITAVIKHDLERPARIRLIALRMQAQRDNDWQPLLEQLETCVQVSNNAGCLLELCDLLARQGQWEALADRADDLAATIESPEAIRLAAIGLFNAARYLQCQNLLDRNTQLFPQGKLSGFLRRLRALCLLNLGVLPEAQLEAERLVQDEPTVDNVMTLVEIHLQRGDLIQIAAVAQRIRNNPDISLEQTLRLAALTRSVDLPLARGFWRHALRSTVPDEFVGAVFDLGMRLGLDAELRDLGPRLARLAEQGRHGMRTMSLPEFPAFADDLRRRSTEIAGHYRDGSLPIHVIVELTNATLIDLYHHSLTVKEQSERGWHQQPLLARHGSRTLAPAIAAQPSQWRLHVDITALLLAAHFDVLDVIEKSFAPLRIPSSLVPALLEMREKLENHQPSRLDAYRHILSLQRQGRLRLFDPASHSLTLDTRLSHELGNEWAALHAYACAHNGYVVDFLPLTKPNLSGEPAVLPANAEQRVTNCRGVIEALRQYDGLSDERYTKAIEALGEEGRIGLSGPIPALRSVLIFRGNTPEVLFDAGVLDLVTMRFRVVIEQDERTHAEEALFFETHQQETLAWLDGLIIRVRDGLGNGVYQRLAETLAERNDERHALFSRCLTALFSFPTQEHDVIWVDDRFVNAYIHRDTAPIISVTDVLQAAVAVGTLSIEQYYYILSRLRAADVRFIPIDSDEIYYALSRAPVGDNGRLVETDHLVNLRRYIARCLLLQHTLQWPPLPEREPAHPNIEGEVAFIVGLHRALDDAILAVWSANTSVDVCRARASWITNNLLFDALMARTVQELPVAEDQQVSSQYLGASSGGGPGGTQVELFGALGDEVSE